MGEVMLKRRHVVHELLKNREDAAVVCGLGSPTYDVAAVSPSARNFYLWGAMGGAAMMGLGLALARPEIHVIVVTGDGEALMGINALAAPVFDANNELAGTISIVGSIQHLTANPDEKMIAAVSKAAAQVSARLGYREEKQE